MKNIFLIILLTCLSTSHSQKYFFNTITKYSSTIKNENNRRENVIYLNSNDDSYYLRIFKSKYSFTANLYDLTKCKIHIFNIKESSKNGEIFFQFEYEKSESIISKNKDYYSKHIFKFQDLEINDSLKKVNLKVLKNSNKKNAIIEYNLEIRKEKVNLFPAFRICCIHPYEFYENLNLSENGIVINGIGNTISGQIIEHKLEDLKEVDFELEAKMPE